MRFANGFVLRLLPVAALLAATPALGVTSLDEHFNDITTLAGSGWSLQNHSQPLGEFSWFQGVPASANGPFDAYDGAANAYIAANFKNTGSTGTISNWLLTPVLDFGAGATLTFYTRKPSPDSYADRLEVRYSTAGSSTDVGVSATDVGVFTHLSQSINPDLVLGVYPTTWTQFTITGLPHNGSGRIALRYFVTSAGTTGTNSDYIGIDAVTYTTGGPEFQVGGSIAGLNAKGLVLQLNGGNDLPISTGATAFLFPTYLTDGGAYNVTVATQPLGQNCTVGGGAGTVSGADVSSVAVTCVDLAPVLTFSVDDGRAYARYGQTLDYLVTLSNVSAVAAVDAPLLASTPGTALDLAHAHWQCFGAGAGASCPPMGVGPSMGPVSLPIGASLTWIVSVPVLPGSTDGDAVLQIGSGAAMGTDTDTLVIFRHTFDASYSDGTNGANGTNGASSGGSLRLPGTGSEVFALPPANGGGIAPVKAWREGDSELRVECVVLGATQYLRLWQRDASGAEHASAWSAAAPGATLALGVVEAGGRRSAVLEGAASPLALPLVR